MAPTPGIAGMEPEIVPMPGADSVRICGVTYTLEFFRALAKRLPTGTHVAGWRRDDGTFAMHHHAPGPKGGGSIG